MTRSIVSRCFYFYFYLLSLLSVASAFNNGSGSGNSQHATKRVSIVTGANGYVGREVVKAILLSDGDDGDDDNNNNNNNNKSKSKNCCNKDEILCLVRSNRVESETEYWKGFRRSSSSRPASPTIKVLPYDMLDGGKTIAEALDYVAAEAAAEAEAASDAAAAEAAAASEAAADRNTPGSSNSNSNSNGCSIICVVYHIASVFGPSEDHITTAKDNVRGTKDLVEAVGKFSKSNSKSHYSSSCCCCCRLVVTSSMAAVRGSGQTPLNGEYYTHEDWNTYSKLGDNWGSSYQWSKMESERIAWEIAREQDISMTSICPSFVFGPPTTTSASASADNNNDNNNNNNKEPANNNNNNNLSGSYSITLFGQWIRGESPVQSRLFVDVRDVARAHVLAGTRPKAIGERIIVSTEARIPSQEMAEVLTGVVAQGGGLVPGDPSRIGFDGDFQGGAIPIGAKEVDSKARLKDVLGLTRLTPVHETIRDMGRSLLLQQQVAATTTTTTTTTTVQQQ